MARSPLPPSPLPHQQSAARAAAEKRIIADSSLLSQLGVPGSRPAAPPSAASSCSAGGRPLSRGTGRFMAGGEAFDRFQGPPGAVWAGNDAQLGSGVGGSGRGIASGAVSGVGGGAADLGRTGSHWRDAAPEEPLSDDEDEGGRSRGGDDDDLEPPDSPTANRFMLAGDPPGSPKFFRPDRTPDSPTADQFVRADEWVQPSSGPRGVGDDSGGGSEEDEDAGPGLNARGGLKGGGLHRGPPQLYAGL